MAEENITWDDAIDSGKYVKFTQDPEDNTGKLFLPKVIVITNWVFKNVDKFEKKQVEFVSDCVEEDGEKVEEKFFTATSTRMKTALRPILENKDNTDRVKISILKTGKAYDTQYFIKEIKSDVSTTE